MSDEKMRTEFEKWADKHCMSLVRINWKDGSVSEYAYTSTFDAWQVWQAARLSALPSLVDSVKRIRHFATGSCDMPLETRLKCIAKECEASLSKFDVDWREAQDAAK
jgi:hypothetical protein